MSNNPVIRENLVTPMSSPDLEKVPEIFIRHIGTWQGEFIKTDNRGHFEISFLANFTIWIQGSQYNQVNNYEYSDGSRLQLKFQGEFEERILKLSSGSYSDFSAIAWDAGQDTMCYRSNKTQDNVLITFVETITLVGKNYRVRSTQAFKNGIFNGISFIEEMRLP